MTGIAEIGAATLSASQRRLEIISQNISNIGTSGYQARQPLQSVIDLDSLAAENVFSDDLSEAILSSTRPPMPGELSQTGNPFDLGLASSGFFALRSPSMDAVDYTRAGQFLRNEKGQLTDQRGWVLQSIDRRDIRIAADNVVIAEDGTVFENGLPTDRIGVFQGDVDGAHNVRGFEGIPHADIRMMQGMLESSNTNVAEEMVEMMAAIRQAEIGAQILQSYDTLIGQAISSLGRTS